MICVRTLPTHINGVLTSVCGWGGRTLWQQPDPAGERVTATLRERLREVSSWGMHVQQGPSPPNASYDHQNGRFWGSPVLIDVPPVCPSQSAGEGSRCIWVLHDKPPVSLCQEQGRGRVPGLHTCLRALPTPTTHPWLDHFSVCKSPPMLSHGRCVGGKGRDSQKHTPAYWGGVTCL